MDKESRKKILDEVKHKEEEKLISALPVSKELLKDFFDYLDKRLNEEVAGHSLKLTEEFCKRNDIDFEKIKKWAADLGGYDDAEILWNVEQEYEFLIGDNRE